MEPPGVLTVDNGSVGDYGAAIYSAQEYGGAHVLHAQYYGNQSSATAVYGDATQGDLWTTGGEFHGNGYGVYATAEGEGSSGFMYGVRGHANNGTGTSNLYSIYGADPIGNGSVQYAGYFAGDTHVSGTLTKAAGSFKIDHPLDPENMYLSHSFVESPDMMNVYNGNVVLDGAGEATVRLPDYFDALNRDFRYQLTCIGAFAPVYVAEEISGSSFRIAGGEPGMKISWMVTGIRQDRYAEEHRIPVEEPKTGHALGRYMHPEEHGQLNNRHHDDQAAQHIGHEAGPCNRVRHVILVARIPYPEEETGQQGIDHRYHDALDIGRVTYVRAAMGLLGRRESKRVGRIKDRSHLLERAALSEERAHALVQFQEKLH